MYKWISPAVLPPNRPVVDTRSRCRCGSSGGGLGGAFFSSDFSHFVSCHTTPQKGDGSQCHATNARRPPAPSLVGPSRAGRSMHLELEFLSLFRACHTRDTGVEGRHRLAKGVAGDVVASLVVDDMLSASHLVLPDHGLLSAHTVRRPAQQRVGWPVRLGWVGAGDGHASHMAVQAQRFLG